MTARTARSANAWNTGSDNLPLSSSATFATRVVPVASVTTFSTTLNLSTPSAPASLVQHSRTCAPISPRCAALSALVSLLAGLPPLFGWPPARGLGCARGGWFCCCNCRNRNNVASSAALFCAVFGVGFGCDVALGFSGGGVSTGGTGGVTSAWRVSRGGAGGAGGGGMIGAGSGLGSGGGKLVGAAFNGVLTCIGSGGGGGGGGGGGASIGSGFGASVTGGAGGAISFDGAGGGAGVGALIVVFALPSKIISTAVSGSFSSSFFQFGSVITSARITI